MQLLILGCLLALSPAQVERRTWSALVATVPRTAALLSEASPMLTASKTPTPLLRRFTNAVFRVLDANIEPRNTGFLERTKVAASELLAVGVMPDINLSNVAIKWNCKANYKVLNAEYRKLPPYGDALTEDGYATIRAHSCSAWPEVTIE